MTWNFRLLGVLLALLLALTGSAAAQDEWGDDDDDDEESSEETDGDVGDDDGDDDEVVDPAGDDVPQDGATREKFPLRLLVALKGGGGGNYQNVPDQPPPSSRPFDDGAGGWGAMLGVTVQATAFKGLLGLEMGLLYDWGHTWSKFTFNNADTEWGYEFSTMRFPLLLEVGTPGEGSRLSFGTGPEFAFGGDAEVVATSDDFGGVNDTRATGGQGSTFWIFNLGAELGVEDYLAVTFDIHYAMNLDAESVYVDRFDNPNDPFTLQAKNDHELRLMLGVGYVHDLAL